MNISNTFHAPRSTHSDYFASSVLKNHTSLFKITDSSPFTAKASINNFS